MTQPRTLEDMFEQARLMENDVDRDLFIKAVCDGDASREQQLRQLLMSAQRPSPLDGTLTEVALARSYLTGELTTIQIGQWRLLRVLGSGGMGVVYLAEQREPVYRQAALKMIQLGCQSRQAIWRFEQEQQTLSRLDHPNIARLIEASMLPSGTSWLVMEYVRGQDLLSFCEQFGMTVEQRLHLFLQCCSAIRHAHQQAVIHRDLKPSNIMVSGDQNEAMVKVIDFGVAKVLSQTESLAGRLSPSEGTQSGVMPGTLKYMSPEQARNGDIPVDTRTDVYSLGAVLYVLLTGHEAYGGSGTAGAVEQLELLERIIRDEPVTMSRRVLQEAHGAEASRRELASRLARQLRGDLDAIVQKAMAKELSRRYQSVAQFADDIQRYLNRVPIDARPHSLGYQISRKLVRNKGVCIAVLSVFISLLTGLLIAVNQRNRAESSELSLRSRNYAADLLLASLLQQQGDSTQAIAALERQIPTNNNVDPRGLDWQLLRALSVTDVKLLHREPRSLYFVCPLPGEREIAVCGQDADIVLLDAETGEVRTRIPSGQGEVNGLAVSPNGKLLASAGDDGTIAIWDISTGQEVGKRGKVHQRQCWQVGWSPDGKTLITCGNEMGVQLRSFPELKSLGTVPTLTDLECLSVSHKGLIAIGGEAGTLTVVPVPNMQIGSATQLELQNGFAPSGHFFNTSAVCFSADGSYLAVLSQSSKVQVFDTSEGVLREVMQWEVADRALSVAFSANGQLLAVGLRNGGIEVVNVRSPQSALKLTLFQKPAGGGPLRSVSGGFQDLVESSEPLSTDGTFPGDTRQIVLQMKTADAAGGYAENYRFSRVNPQSSTSGADYFVPEGVSVSGRTVTLMLPREILQAEQQTGGQRNWQAHRDEVISVCFSQDDQSLISVSRDGTICRSRFASWQPISLVRRNVHGVVLPIGDRTAITRHGGEGTNVPPGSYATGLVRPVDQVIRPDDAGWPLKNQFARHFQLTRDRRSLVVICEDERQINSAVHVYDIDRQVLRPVFETPPGDRITALTRDGSRSLLVYEVQRVTAADPGTKQAELYVHDLQANRVLNRAPLNTNGLAEILTSPDQKWCVVDGRPELAVYSVPSLTHKVLPTPRSTRNSLIILPDNQTLIVAFADRMLRRYDLGTGELVQEIPVIGREIEGLAITADGKTLLGCSSDGTLQAWQTNPFLQSMILQLPVSKLRNLSLDPSGNAIWLRDQYDQLFLLDARLDARFLLPSSGAPY